VIFEFDEFELDAERQELRRAGAVAKADPLLLRLLETFLRRPGQLIATEELVAHVWAGRAVSDNALTVAMTRLRKALGHARGARNIIANEYGQGYRFLSTVVARASHSKLASTDGARTPSSSPFVGRDRVMGHLDAALSDARSGSGGAIVLTGEAGIGKTRVAEMLAREAAAADVPVAWAYCRELGDTPPLWPFSGLLREALAFLPRAVIDADARFLALRPELARLLPELASHADTAAPQHQTTESWLNLASKHRVFDAVSRALQRVAEHTPCVLIMDDVHRADASSLDLLHYFLAGIPRLRILFLATARSDEQSESPQLLAILNHRNCTPMALQPLSEPQVTSYVTALFGQADSSLSHALFEKSEGNPLFMTELARQLRESEHADLALLKAPSVALELVRQRVAGLDHAAHGALSAAAVIGRSFSLPLLQAITDREANDLMASLDEAVARRVIEPARDAPTEFVFTHDLLRSALYDALEPSRHRSRHLCVAQVLHERAALGEVPAADVAYHAWSALPEGDLRKTVDHCVAAADAAARVSAHSDAARYLKHARQALDLLDGGSPRLRFRLLWRQASYVRLYSAREFRPLAEQLLHLARELGTGAALAQAAMLLDSFPGFPQLPGARDALADALSSLPEDAHFMRSALQARLAISAPLAYDAAKSGEQLDQALELARRSPEAQERIVARFAELYLYGGPAHRPRAAAAMQDLQDVCTEDPSVFALPLVLLDVHRALIAAQDGDLATMARALDRGEARCRELDIELRWHVERLRALSRINAGHLAEGRAALRELHERAAGSAPVAGAELFCAYDRCVVLAAGKGRGESWERALAPDRDDPPNLWALKLRALAASGALDEARSALAAVPASALTSLPCDREYLGTLGALTRAALTLHAPDHARVLYELLLPYPGLFAVNLAFLCEGSVSQLLGLLARSLGEPAKARLHFEAAIAASEQAGFMPCAAEARLEHARG